MKNRHKKRRKLPQQTKLQQGKLENLSETVKGVMLKRLNDKQPSEQPKSNLEIANHHIDTCTPRSYIVFRVEDDNKNGPIMSKKLPESIKTKLRSREEFNDPVNEDGLYVNESPNEPRILFACPTRKSLSVFIDGQLEPLIDNGFSIKQYHVSRRLNGISNIQCIFREEDVFKSPVDVTLDFIT